MKIVKRAKNTMITKSIENMICCIGVYFGQHDMNIATFVHKSNQAVLDLKFQLKAENDLIFLATAFSSLKKPASVILSADKKADKQKIAVITSFLGKQSNVKELYYFSNCEIQDIFSAETRKENIIKKIFQRFVLENYLFLDNSEFNVRQIFALFSAMLLFESINDQDLVFDLPSGYANKYRWINVRRSIQKLFEKSLAVTI